MSSPGTLKGGDKEETYTTLDGALDVPQTAEPVRLESPQSQWFVRESSHLAV